jgi:hypothetical protein
MTLSKLTMFVCGTVLVTTMVGACGTNESPAPAAAAPAAETGPKPGPGEPDLATVKQLTERFRDVNVALKEGYIRDPFDLCDTAEMMGRPTALGAMGIHYFKPDVLGITAPPNPKVTGTGIHTDFNAPSILLYEPQADGSLELVGVENLAFEDAWKAAGNSKPPTFHGVAYNYMIDDPATTAIDEAHQFMPHYDRHVWIYRENPNGVFAPFNPKVSCAHHQGKTLKMTH